MKTAMLSSSLLLLLPAIWLQVDAAARMSEVWRGDRCALVKCGECTRCKDGLCIADFTQPGCKKAAHQSCDSRQCPECHECLLNEKGEPKCVKQRDCCPRSQPAARCYESPCINWKERCPKADQCIESNCGSCVATFYDKSLNELTGAQCSDSASFDPCLSANCGLCSKCVATKTPCLNPPCQQYECQMDLKCEEERQCVLRDCQPGTVCKLVDGLARCVAEAAKENKDRVKQCSQPPESGTCRGFFRRYYYNRLLGRCMEFVYGGCGGNENKFLSMAQCESRCQDIEPCAMPMMRPPPPGCVYKDVIGENGCPWPELFCDERPGQCPRWTERATGPCASNCAKDSDCGGGEKCCRSACGASTCTQVAVLNDPAPYYIIEDEPLEQIKQ